MMELPEAQTVSKQMEHCLSGKRVMRVEINHTPHKFAFFSMDPVAYSTLLTGMEVTGASAWGGLTELALGEMRLQFGDGCNLRFLSEHEKRPEKHQLLLEFADDTALVCSVQMYGGLHLFQEGTNDDPYYLAARQKPSPLSDAFDRPYFDRLLRDVKPNLSVKAFLATQQRVPGLGNGVLQDILFQARLHPKRKLDTLSREDVSNLFACVRGVLLDMTRQGGRDTEKDLFGAPGGYRTRLSARTWKQPCPRCGGTLLRQAYLGGNVYFCPDCQPPETPRNDVT